MLPQPFYTYELYAYSHFYISFLLLFCFIPMFSSLFLEYFLTPWNSSTDYVEIDLETTKSNKRHHDFETQ